MKSVFLYIYGLQEETVAVLIGVFFAVVSWLFSAAATRRLSRKQHTINLLMNSGMDPAIKAAMELVQNNLNSKTCPNFSSVKDAPKRVAFRLLLNHFEFVAAGLRNGDLDEQLVYDSECHTILDLYNTYLPNIEKRQKERNLGTLYEHTAWLSKRWRRQRPLSWRRFWQLLRD